MDPRHLYLAPRRSILEILSSTFILGALLSSMACSPDLVLRGALHRVVGETVTLSLVEGDESFSDELRLVAADGVAYDKATLKSKLLNEKNLSFVIPPGIAQGSAQVFAGKKESASPFELSLQINRLLIAITDDDGIEILPAPPASIEVNQVQNLNDKVKSIALSPDGSAMTILTEQQYHMLTLGPRSRSLIPWMQQANATAMVTMANGILFCTSSTQLYFNLASNQVGVALTPPSGKEIKGCKALARDRTGSVAVILSTCASSANGQQENCLTPLLAGDPMEIGPTVSTGTADDVAFVSQSADGKRALAVSPSMAVSVDFSSSPSKVSQVTWDAPSTPIAISTGLSPEAGFDLYAVAEAKEKQIHLFKYNLKEGKLSRVTKIQLSQAPTALSFGRGAELYFAIGANFYSLDAAQANPQYAALNLSTKTAVKFLIAQP